MSSIQVELTGDTDKLLRKIYRLKNIDKKSLMGSLAETVRESTDERFKTQKGPDGKAWTPSARVRENGGKTLIASADLRRSIHSEYGEEGFAVGTNKIYAATHQFGVKGRTIRAKNGKCLVFPYKGHLVMVKQVTVNIPPRPFLGISDEDQEEIRELLMEVFKDR